MQLLYKFVNDKGRGVHKFVIFDTLKKNFSPGDAHNFQNFERHQTKNCSVCMLISRFVDPVPKRIWVRDRQNVIYYAKYYIFEHEPPRRGLLDVWWTLKRDRRYQKHIFVSDRK